jgi:hypothetical protein
MKNRREDISKPQERAKADFSGTDACACSANRIWATSSRNARVEPYPQDFGEDLAELGV